MVVRLADFLNANIMNFNPPLWVLGLQTGAALGVPLLAALIPIIAGTRTTVREAISDYGINVAGFNPNGLVNRLVIRLRSASRPVLISIRNTFRQRARSC
jgi:putative ABC transport system permease protein